MSHSRTATGADSAGSFGLANAVRGMAKVVGATAPSVSLCSFCGGKRDRVERERPRRRGGGRGRRCDLRHHWAGKVTPNNVSISSFKNDGAMPQVLLFSFTYGRSVIQTCVKPSAKLRLRLSPSRSRGTP